MSTLLAAHHEALSKAANNGDWHSVVNHCEQFELECISNRMEVSPESGPLYSVHLCAYLIVNDLYVNSPTIDNMNIIKLLK